MSGMFRVTGYEFKKTGYEPLTLLFVPSSFPTQLLNSTPIRLSPSPYSLLLTSSLTSHLSPTHLTLL